MTARCATAYRPPLSQKRLSLTPAGKVCLSLRKPLASGRSQLLFEPVAFLRRLAASLPRPRQNMIRFHGIFAPRAAARSRLAELLPLPPAPPPSLRVHPASAHGTGLPLLAALSHDEARPPVPLPYRRPWAELLKRIHDHDVLRCPRCDKRMVPVQTVKDPCVIRKILNHLGLPSELPPVAPPRAPPQQTFDLDAPFDDELFELPFEV